MSSEEDYAVAFELISHAGNARSEAMNALRSARDGDFADARACLLKAEDDLRTAHQMQTSLVQREAQGEQVPVNIILVHAQDHLMCAIVVRDLAEEMLHLYERLGVPVAPAGA